jgi:uncharacterized repeat protein (TIGR03803 family)
MTHKKFPLGLRAALAILAVALFVTATAVSQEQVLHSFNKNGTDGAYPYAQLVFDAAGNLYGTTPSGGIHDYGTVFELSPQQGGGWTETVLHSFNLNGSDGYNPTAGLILDSAGNLYGTTEFGGIHGAGTVFELTPTGGGNWTETVLHSFNDNGTDGAYPYSALLFDSAGNLYGTTSGGGIHTCPGAVYRCGTVYEMSPRQGGGWTETVLHSFNDNGSDGFSPLGGLIFDAAGNLYGTAYEGGIHGYGTVFELTARQGGGWTETVLHSFNQNGTDGALLYDTLAIDASGNLYGTTYEGGIHLQSCGGVGCGTVFELSPRVGGGWTEKVLHSFNENGTDGALPAAGLILDAAGNLYGTASRGGIHNYGTVFEFSPGQGGNWTELTMHNFNANGADGIIPMSGLIFDAAGNLYGTTHQGGAHNFGTAFELTP